MTHASDSPVSRRARPQPRPVTARPNATASPAAPARLATQVAIVGGGPAGLTLAAALGSAGIDTVVIDRQTAADRSGGVMGELTTALTYGSIRVLEGIDAWTDRMEHGAEAVWRLHVVDGGSPLFLHVEGDAIGDHPYGYNVENSAIRSALLDRVAELPSVADLSPAKVVAYERESGGVTVRLDNGTQVRTALVVGADGRQSPTRKWAGIGVRRWDYDQTAIVCQVLHTEPHRNEAVERLTPEGPFAIVPMRKTADGTDRSAIVWCERRRSAPGYLALPQEAFDREIHTRTRGSLGTVQQIGRRFSYPLSGLHARAYRADRVALMAEAAHAVHPIGAQGLNLSMRDAAVLAEVIVDAARSGQDIAAQQVLARYERWRRFDNMGVIAYTDLFYRSFANTIPPIKLARNLVLGAVNRLEPLKRRIVQDAMGLTGTLPRLARGEAL